MSKQEEIIEVAGKKVVVRYADKISCQKCALHINGQCAYSVNLCTSLDRCHDGINERAYFVEAEQSQEEEIHSLREWAQILATNPDLRAEFDKICPPQPIRGSIAPEADLEEEAERFFTVFPMRANTPGVPDEYLDFETYMLIARHFAEWGAEHLKK